MPHRLMENYDSHTTNIVLAGVSGFFGFLVGGDPAISGIALPVILFIAGKLADFAFRLWRERKNRGR